MTARPADKSTELGKRVDPRLRESRLLSLDSLWPRTASSRTLGPALYRIVKRSSAHFNRIFEQLKLFLFPGWQTISPHNQVYKSKMQQISVNLVDIIDIDSDKG